MPASVHTIEAVPRAGYLEIEITGVGHNSADWVVAIWTEIDALARAHSAKKLLAMDRRICEYLAPEDYEEVGRRLAALDRADVKVAYVELMSSNLHRAEYGEIAARSHGLQLRVFSERSAALAWLLAPGL